MAEDQGYCRIEADWSEPRRLKPASARERLATYLKSVGGRPGSGGLPGLGAYC